MVTASSNNNGNGNATGHAKRNASAPASKKNVRNKTSGRRTSATASGTRNTYEMPSWLSTVISVVGVGVAVGAGLYATRKQWMPLSENWRDEFSAAFADDETDYENFDQTRHAGVSSMRDHPGDDWEEIDDMSDASFPASDPPSFNPGTAG